jgi:hypothetical protein
MPAQVIFESGQSPAPTGPGPGSPRVKMTGGRPSAEILTLNALMKDYAVESNAVYVDYFTAVVGERGWLKDAPATVFIPTPRGTR